MKITDARFDREKARCYGAIARKVTTAFLNLATDSFESQPSRVHVPFTLDILVTLKFNYILIS